MSKDKIYTAVNNQIIVVRKNGGLVSYEPVDIESYFGKNGMGMSGGAVEGEKALSYSFIMDTMRKLMGRTLTIIDASVHDKIQNKAMKDLVRNIYSDEMNFSADMAYDQNVLKKQAEEYFENVSDEELDKSQVTIEEALGVE